MLFSVVLEMLFLVQVGGSLFMQWEFVAEDIFAPPPQAMLVGLIPGVGAILSLFHLAVLYALYSFEYKWIYQGKRHV